MTSKVLIQLYREMLRIRMVEEKIADLYPEREMRCPVHLCIGQEAVAVGVCAHLRREDYVFSAHRSHGHYLAKGGNLKAMMAELWGKRAGCGCGKGGSMHLSDKAVGFLASTPIVASTIPIAVGAALGSVMKDDSRVTVVFFGEAATEEGTFHEAINFAKLKNLPVLFICENNLYSVYSGLSVRQPKGRAVTHLAQGHGVDSVQGNGNNVTEVYQLAAKAVDKARDGKGPVFLEFATYRWREHCGPNYDNQLGYRSEREFLEWKNRCPIERCKNQLLTQQLCSEQDLLNMVREISCEIEEAVRFAKESPYPEAASLFQDIYAS